MPRYLVALLLSSATALPVTQPSTPASHAAVFSAAVVNDNSPDFAIDDERCRDGGWGCHRARLAPSASALQAHSTTTLSSLLRSTAPLRAVLAASPPQPSAEPASLPPSALHREPPVASPVLAPLVGRSILEHPSVPAAALRPRYQITVPAGMTGGQAVQVTLPSGPVRVMIPEGLKEGDLFVIEEPPGAAGQPAPARGEHVPETPAGSDRSPQQQNGDGKGENAGAGSPPPSLPPMR
eukprot:scaffold23043_cov90-Isochrysis_galbana.AAC.1